MKMYKKIAVIITFLITIAGLVAAESASGEYRLKTTQCGGFSLYFMDEKIAEAMPFTVHNEKWKWIFGGFSFRPKESVETVDGKTIIRFTAPDTDVAENFHQTLILTPDGLECEWNCKMLIKIPEMNVLIRLPSHIYAGKDITVKNVQGTQKLVSLPSEFPANPKWNISEWDGKIAALESIGTLGKITFSFTPAQGRFNDPRTEKNPSFSIYASNSNVPAGTQWSQKITISAAEVKP